jgi:hypothetical protein
MSAKERDRRSRLARLAHGAGLLRGTLAPRQRVCGKPNCKCAKGEKHASLYLVVHRDGELRQLCIPKTFEPHVRQWVRNYQEVKELLEQISELYWDKTRKRQE